MILTNEDIKNSNYYRSKKIIPIILNDEIFLDYPLNMMYMISNYGRVFCKRGYMVTPFINRNGYISCKIDEQNMLVHRMVLLTFNFVNNYMDLDVNHIDGNKTNNHISNLEWCSRSYNVQHSFNIGLSKLGENHPNSKYSNEQIHYICKLLENGYSAKSISEKLNVSCDKNFRKFISKIVHKKLWTHISKNYNI
jgi:hypothetical protein